MNKKKNTKTLSTYLKKCLVLALPLFCLHSLLVPWGDSEDSTRSLGGVEGVERKALRNQDNKSAESTQQQKSNKVLKQQQVGKSPKHLPPRSLYDSTCPLAMESYFHLGKEAEAAELLSQESGGFEIVQSAIKAPAAFAERKVIVLGDSTARQVFSSLSCLLYNQGFWESSDSFTYGLNYNGFFYDARLGLNDSGEIFYAPFAGGVLDFWKHGVGGRPEIRPLRSQESWQESCKERKAFYLDHYKLSATNGDSFEEYDAGNASLEKIKLGKKDIIFLQGGLHPCLRKQNLENIGALLKCVEEAKENGEDPGWPTIKYLRTSPQHFNTNNGQHGGMYNKILGKTPCISSLDVDSHLVEELEVFGKDYKMVGHQLDVLDQWGNAHNNKNDCTHWIMPGVPDLYAREITMAVMATA